MSHPTRERPRRRSPRRGVLLRCQVVRERDFRLVADLALDLSTEGMLVSTDARVLTGEPLLVSFRVPRTGAWIDAPASVARVVHGRRPSDAGRCLGLVFGDMPTKDATTLKKALRSLPLADPGRSGAS